MIKRDEKPQYDINRETAKISVLSLPSNQSQIIEQAKFISFRKSFRKTNKRN